MKNLFAPLRIVGMASLTVPVKVALAESFAILISSKLSSQKMRSDLNMTILKECNYAKSSQLRVIFVLFIEQLVKVISARLFQDSFAIPFLDSLTKESVLSLQI